MKTRTFALVLGIGFLAAGILGFVPGLVSPSGDPAGMGMEGMTHGRLFGLFAVNALHNLVHLAFGVWGVVVWRDFAASRLYAQVVAVAYAVLVVLGLIPAVNTLFGLVPLYGHNVWLHAVLAVAAGFFGFVPVATVESTRVTARRP
ncbi:MAG: DUF4383 domain-containing protein [Magnetospirillum sp.]|nr:DUF4383 domain-containing protein [Magnetospirillum sp.]